jgi:hypothetical protein
MGLGVPLADGVQREVAKAGSARLPVRDNGPSRLPPRDTRLAGV